MTRYLIKPIVFLLIVGLLGCTTTKWGVFKPPESPVPIPHIRVTLIDESQFELYNVIITRETIWGTKKGGRPFWGTMDEVRTVEIYSGWKLHPRTVTFVITVGLVVLLINNMPFRPTVI